jgi:hypothetical protein
MSRVLDLPIVDTMALVEQSHSGLVNSHGHEFNETAVEASFPESR